MGIDPLSAHFFDEIGESIGVTIEVGVIDLEYIACKDDFGSFTGAGDDGFDFVGSEVLCFIDNEAGFHKATSANV